MYLLCGDSVSSIEVGSLFYFFDFDFKRYKYTDSFINDGTIAFKFLSRSALVLPLATIRPSSIQKHTSSNPISRSRLPNERA